MSKIELLLLIVFLLLLILLFKYLQTKRQIRNLSKQIAELVNGKSEKMLDISLIDKDLEQLAGMAFIVFCAVQNRHPCIDDQEYSKIEIT